VLDRRHRQRVHGDAGYQSGVHVPGRPDPTVPCKHILFVLLHFLGLSLDEACVWRQTLRPCQVARLIGTPRTRTCSPTHAPGKRFHQMWSVWTVVEPADARWQEASSRRPLDGAACPVCLEEMAQTPPS
jgi:hypothetical protein